MTAVPASDRISELRELFRHLTQFHATHELTGLEDITTPYGHTWSLWDLDYLYSIVCERLTLRQRQAITLCLIRGVKEADAAELMGVSRTNPVMMYATLGIKTLLDMIDRGELERFNRPSMPPGQGSTSLKELADFVRSKIVVYQNCWLFPNRTANPPRLLLRSKRTMVGYVLVSPMEILWRDEVGPVPPGCRVEHSKIIPSASIACVRHHHGELIMPDAYRTSVQHLATRYIQQRKIMI